MAAVSGKLLGNCCHANLQTPQRHIANVPSGIDMYIHVCTMFRHIHTVLPYPVQVGRIPDVVHLVHTGHNVQ